ncbi:aspartic-type endopeptidase [Hirsutella rhossiliensis]|uniref:Aspartic-type endopeptidase n=1 Tax=Hirsutella rhossiliensis TaxID=111463 RepID=A0A9P8MYG4_9HYPO|nr:aspartic-type endopeptidase [Hirsutella rhossiliensis]KAH0963534.1 aspartic-type endopeptidase [Hirsutella rhossiliensis]
MLARLVGFGLLASNLAASSSCPQQPFQLPIKDVQVYPNVANSFMTGIPAKIGTPSQDIVLLPWTELNNTWIYDQQVSCVKTVVRSDFLCDIRRGRPFDEDKSTTFQKATDIVAAGGATVEASYQGSERGIPKLIASGLGGTESFAPGGKDGLNDFPIGIPRLQWDHGYTTLHPLGLGSNSTYLNALRQAGRIGSRVFSIFWGRVWDDYPVDGALVVGGYDKEKTIGPNFTAPLDYGDFGDPSGCWTGMKVHITDIQLNNLDGSDVSLLPSSANMPACIVPQRQSLMEVPRPLLHKFERVTRTKSNGTSSGLHWGAPIFSADNVFEGDLTIVLSSGLKVRVPNTQFITPHLDMDRNGTRTLDDDQLDLVITGIENQPATLGRYFLTSAYLMVNHDAKAFTLWQANPTTSSSLVPVLDEKTAKKCGNANGITQSSMSRTPSDASKPSGAVIGGAVAGGVVAALLGLGTFFLIRRRRQNAGGEQASPDGGSAVSEHKLAQFTPGGAADAESWAQEMDGSPVTATEMYSSNHEVYEMDADAYGHRAVPDDKEW